METSHWALLVSALGLLVIVLERTFGGGNGLANRFAGLKETVKQEIADVRREAAAEVAKARADATTEISSVRRDTAQRIDEYEGNYRVGLEAIKSNIHELQLAALKFRAEMAEGYIPKGGLDDVRREMRDGLSKVDKAIEHLQDMIMWAGPSPTQGDAQPPKPRRGV